MSTAGASPPEPPEYPEYPDSQRLPARLRLRRAGRAVARRPGLVAAALMTGILLVATLAPETLTAANPLTGTPADKLRPPGLHHLFGTDQLGRDLFARVVHGTARSLGTSLLAVAAGLIIGSAAGLVAGLGGGWLDELLMRAVDTLLAIPALLLSLALVTVLGVGAVSLAVAVAVPTVAHFARVMRAETLRVRQAAFVEAARAVGAGWWWVLVRHVLPHARGPVTVLAVLESGTAVLSMSGLSFLGYGTAPPAPEWGSLIADGRDYLATAWWLSVLPGLAIVLTVLAINRIADALDGEKRTPDGERTRRR
jgi:peptide/nickel transport system permease protein